MRRKIIENESTLRERKNKILLNVNCSKNKRSGIRERRIGQRQVWHGDCGQYEIG